MTDTVLICLWVETVGVRPQRHCLSTRTAMISNTKNRRCAIYGKKRTRGVELLQGQLEERRAQVAPEPSRHLFIYRVSTTTLKGTGPG